MSDVDAATMATLSALSKLVDAAGIALDSVGDWADERRTEAVARLGLVTDAGVDDETLAEAIFADFAYNAALDQVQRAMLIDELAVNLQRDFLRRTTAPNISEGRDPSPPAVAPVPALPAARGS